MDSLPHLLWTCAADGACEYLSPQWISYTGRPEQEQLGYGWLEQLHPDDIELTKTRWGRAAESGGFFDTEFRIRRFDGTYRWFKTRAVPDRDDTGRITGWIGSNTDVQDLRDAQDAGGRLNGELEQRVEARTEELRATNSRLEAVAAQLHTALRVAYVGSWEFEVKTGKTYWSEELYRILRMTPQSAPLTREQGDAMFAADSRTRLDEAVANSIATGEPYELLLTAVRTDGESRSVVARGEALRGALGDVERLVGAIQDTTDRERAGQQLERLTERLRLATSAAKMGVWDWDVQSNTLVWDETMHDLYGVPRDVVGGYGLWRAALHPDDREQTEAIINASLVGPQDFSTTFRIVRADGEIRHLRAVATAHRDPVTGRAHRMVGLNWDITEKRMAEQALQTSEYLQRAILAQAGSCIIATDLEGTITLFNRAAEELLGFTAAEVVGRATPALLHDPIEVSARRAVLEEELGVPIPSPFEVFVIKTRSGRVDANEWSYLRKDGARVPVLLTCSSIRDRSGAITGFLGVAVDLTEQKTYKLALQALNGQLIERSVHAESANTAKSAFVANMSHEIRTPLGAITGVAYLLGKTQLTGEQADLLLTIERSAKTLHAMISDVLDLSKIEAQQLRLEIAPFHVGQALDELGALMAGFGVGKALELIVDVDPTLPDYVGGDRVRVMQVLTNLAGNAVKFTQKGSVRVVALRSTAATSDANGEKVWLKFEVHDSGPGIDDEVVGKLFTRFARGPETAARRVGGTGLGLAIAKELVTMMGGRIGVETTRGVGSRFWFEIPLDPATGAERGVRPPPLNVLVVDDHDEQRRALVASSRRLGWRAEAARSGLEAFAMVLGRATAGVPFDAVILDWRMPGIDGLKTLGAIRRQWGDANDRPAVIMVTANDADTFREQPDAGMADAVLSKPVTSSTLFDAVAKAITARSGSNAFLGAAIADVDGMKRLAGVRVLVVDDSDVNRDIARQILALEGAEVETADNGREAIERVLSTSHRFDVVVMDIQMPEVDGVEAARRIRETIPQSELPIVALTAGVLAAERQRASEAGMNDFLAKPFDPRALIASVRRHVEHARGAPISVVSKRPSRPPQRANWPVVVGIDADDAYARLGGDVELFRSSLGRLYTELGHLDLGSVTFPLDTQRSAELASRMHKLRGTAGNLGARELHKAAAEVEDALRTGVVARLPGGLRKVIAEAERVRNALEGVVAAGPDPQRGAEGTNELLEERLTRFVRLLKEQDLDALPAFADLSPILSSLGPTKHARLRAAMDNLDFATAVNLVAPLQPS